MIMEILILRPLEGGGLFIMGLHWLYGPVADDRTKTKTRQARPHPKQTTGVPSFQIRDLDELQSKLLASPLIT